MFHLLACNPRQYFKTKGPDLEYRSFKSKPFLRIFLKSTGQLIGQVNGGYYIHIYAAVGKLPHLIILHLSLWLYAFKTENLGVTDAWWNNPVSSFNTTSTCRWFWCLRNFFISLLFLNCQWHAQVVVPLQLSIKYTITMGLSEWRPHCTIICSLFRFRGTVLCGLKPPLFAILIWQNSLVSIACPSHRLCNLCCQKKKKDAYFVLI